MLVEYQVLNQQVIAAGNGLWQVVAIVAGLSFTGGVVVLQGLIARSNMEGLPVLVVAVIFLVALIAIVLVLLTEAHAKRVKWLQQLHYARMRQIERQFGLQMQGSTMVDDLDSEEEEWLRRMLIAGIVGDHNEEARLMGMWQRPIRWFQIYWLLRAAAGIWVLLIIYLLAISVLAYWDSFLFIWRIMDT